MLRFVARLVGFALVCAMFLALGYLQAKSRACW